MKFLVKDTYEREVSVDPVEINDEINLIEDLEDIALDRVANAPLNKIIEQYNLEKNATDIQ